jgi:acetyl-CoA carboxylase carboxyltransferase component
MGGHVIGFVANNSAVASGQVDIDAAYKNARFIRFCNLYNIPMIFMEDTTGFLPGKDQESKGIVQAGRAMLDSIIDLRTPRFLVMVRNAFGGAYASYNCYATGADFVIALPSTRAAVMGTAGVEFVYKNELRTIRAAVKAGEQDSGWAKEQEAKLVKKYEDLLMNPNEALSLGSISQIAMPRDLRQILCKNMDFHLKHYKPEPFTSVQREFY